MLPCRTASAITLMLATTLLPGRSAVAEPDDYANPDRPGIADGSNVVGPGRFQIETGIQQEFRHADGAGDRRIFIPTLLRLGLTDELEARVETNAYTWERSSDPSTGMARTEGGYTHIAGVQISLSGLQRHLPTVCRNDCSGICTFRLWRLSDTSHHWRLQVCRRLGFCAYPFA
jgi:hypothetical protein